jgi:hypothetical protein
MMLHGKGPGRHPLGGASYLDMDTVLNEHKSDHRILSDALHRYPGVMKNEQRAFASTDAEGKEATRA